MPDWSANLEVFAAVGVLGFSVVLLAVSALSYRRIRSRRILFIALGFLLFAVKGAWLTARSYEARHSETWILPTALLDLAILLSLYISMRLG